MQFSILSLEKVFGASNGFVASDPCVGVAALCQQAIKLNEFIFTLERNETTKELVHDSRIYPYLYHNWFFEILRARRGSLNWKSKGTGELMIGMLEALVEGVGSRADRQECESTNKLTTLLTIAESSIQHKIRDYSHV